MPQENLEQKVDQEKAEILTKDILKNFAYFSAAYHKISTLQRNDPTIDAYIQHTFDKVYSNVKPETKEYLKPALDVIAGSPEFAIRAIERYNQLYNDKFEKAKCGDIINSATESGYKGKLPDFLQEYKNESLKSIKEKYKAQIEKKDNKITAVLNSLNILHSVIINQASRDMEDSMTSMQFENLSKIYNKPNENKEDKKEQIEVKDASFE